MNLTEKFLQFALLGAEWVLWLLVALSVLSVYVMIERVLFFRSVRGDDARVRRGVVEALTDGDVEEARRQVRGAVGPGGRIVAYMLEGVHRGRDAIVARSAAVRPEERLRLEKNLSFLGTLGANAPFIGLFGTVLGIMRAFNDLATKGLQAGGESTTQVMEGISEALVATAVGLLVAIPAVVAYNLAQRRVKRLLSEADALANTALSLLAGPPVSSAVAEEKD